MMKLPETAGMAIELIMGAGGMLVLMWPVSVAALVLAIGALLFPTPRVRSYFGRGFFILGASYLFPFVILLVGLVLRYDGPPHPNWHEPPVWRVYVLQAFILIHLLVIIAAVALLRGRRVRAAALVLPGLWLSFCALAPAGFAVQGVGP